MTHVEKSYGALSRLFHTWVRIMEYHTRRMEVHDSSLGRSSILIVSAPTDAGIGALTRDNADGECFLLCFSHALEATAHDYCGRHGVQHLTTLVAPFFHVPLPDEELDSIYANCLFDLCEPPDVGGVLDEMWRVLKQGGHLYSVHMGVPSHLAARAWTTIIRTVGFRPVTLVPTLLDRGFAVRQDLAPERFGFPLRYVEAEKPLVH